MFGSVRPAGLADTGSTVASTSLCHRITAPSEACPGHSAKVQPPWKDFFLPNPLGNQGDAWGGSEDAAGCRRQGGGQRPVSTVAPQPLPSPTRAIEHQQRPIGLGIAPCLPHMDKGFGSLDIVDHGGVSYRSLSRWPNCWIGFMTPPAPVKTADRIAAADYAFAGSTPAMWHAI